MPERQTSHQDTQRTESTEKSQPKLGAVKTAMPMVKPTPSAFRTVMGQYPTGVCVVSTLDSMGRPTGLTVNSFTSVSLEPPLILWCIGQNASCAHLFHPGHPFAISILAEDQQYLGKHFSQRGGSKFRSVSYIPGISGVPLVPESCGYLQCTVKETIPAGDHVIVIGTVECISLGTCGKNSEPDAPLAYHQGSWQRLAPPS